MVQNGPFPVFRAKKMRISELLVSFLQLRCRTYCAANGTSFVKNQSKRDV